MVVIIIQAFVNSESDLPDVGRLWEYYPMHVNLIPQKQFLSFEEWVSRSMSSCLWQEAFDSL